MDNVADIGKFNEQGRGVPIMVSRPGPALPTSPITRQAIANNPLARLGWAQGLITVADVMLEPPTCALRADDPLKRAAALMLRDESGFVPVCDAHGRFLGIVTIDAILRSVADDRTFPNARAAITTQIPTCGLNSTLVDAVRQMIACYVRKIPVVGDAEEFLGMLTMAEAAAESVRDPAVAEVIDRFAHSPSLFARLLR